MAVIKKTIDKKYWGQYAKKRLLCTVGGDVNWCSPYRKQYESSSGTLKENYQMIQQSHFWLCISKGNENRI